MWNPPNHSGHLITLITILRTCLNVRIWRIASFQRPGQFTTTFGTCYRSQFDSTSYGSGMSLDLIGPGIFRCPPVAAALPHPVPQVEPRAPYQPGLALRPRRRAAMVNKVSPARNSNVRQPLHLEGRWIPRCSVRGYIYLLRLALASPANAFGHRVLMDWSPEIAQRLGVSQRSAWRAVASRARKVDSATL
jgi:hypothetical protein